MSPQLVDVVAVDPSEHVQCQGGCGHGVYRAIHVVRCEDGGLRVYGSDCAERLFGAVAAGGRGGASGSPGRLLLKEDRDFLASNTAAFVARFEAEQQRQRQEQGGESYGAGA